MSLARTILDLKGDRDIRGSSGKKINSWVKDKIPTQEKKILGDFHKNGWGRLHILKKTIKLGPKSHKGWLWQKYGRSETVFDVDDNGNDGDVDDNGDIDDNGDEDVDFDYDDDDYDEDDDDDVDVDVDDDVDDHDEEDEEEEGETLLSF